MEQGHSPPFAMGPASRVIEVPGQEQVIQARPQQLLTLRQLLPHHRLSHRIAGATDAAHPLVHQDVADQQSTQFMGEFKRLNQALFLKLMQRPALSQVNRPPHP
jgi:hypothetical protein